MKVKLIYKLPEDAADHRRAFYAGNTATALWQIEQYLRDVEKYEKLDTIVDIRATFYDILEANNINLDSLIE